MAKSLQYWFQMPVHFLSLRGWETIQFNSILLSKIKLIWLRQTLLFELRVVVVFPNHDVIAACKLIYSPLLPCDVIRSLNLLISLIQKCDLISTRYMLTTIGPLHVSMGLNLGEVDAVIVNENKTDFCNETNWSVRTKISMGAPPAVGFRTMASSPSPHVLMFICDYGTRPLGFF